MSQPCRPGEVAGDRPGAGAPSSPAPHQSPTLSQDDALGMVPWVTTSGSQSFVSPSMLALGMEDKPRPVLSPARWLLLLLLPPHPGVLLSPLCQGRPQPCSGCEQGRKAAVQEITDDFPSGAIICLGFFLPFNSPNPLPQVEQWQQPVPQHIIMDWSY